MTEEVKNAGEVANVAQSAVAHPGRPAMGRGHESPVDQDDFEIPRAKVVQFTSEEVKAKDPADRVEAGKFINSVSKKEIPAVFVPIFRYNSYTKWNPRKKDDPNYDPAFEPGDMIFTTTNRHDERIGDGLDFKDGMPPAVTKTINFLCLFEGQKTPMLLSFQKTSFRGGKRLNTLLEEAGGDMFSNKFKVVITQESGAGGDYFAIDVRGNGKATDEEFKAAEAIYNRFYGKDIEAKVHKEKEQFQD